MTFKVDVSAKNKRFLAVKKALAKRAVVFINDPNIGQGFNTNHIYRVETISKDLTQVKLKSFYNRGGYVDFTKMRLASAGEVKANERSDKSNKCRTVQQVVDEVLQALDGTT